MHLKHSGILGIAVPCIRCGRVIDRDWVEWSPEVGRYVHATCVELSAISGRMRVETTSEINNDEDDEQTLEYAIPDQAAYSSAQDSSGTDLAAETFSSSDHQCFFMNLIGLDPIYVALDMDIPTILRLRQTCKKVRRFVDRRHRLRPSLLPIEHGQHLSPSTVGSLAALRPIDSGVSRCSLTIEHLLLEPLRVQSLTVLKMLRVRPHPQSAPVSLDILTRSFPRSLTSLVLDGIEFSDSLSRPLQDALDQLSSLRRLSMTLPSVPTVATFLQTQAGKTAWMMNQGLKYLRFTKPKSKAVEGFPSILLGMVARITSLEALELPELNNDKTVVPIQRLREDVIHAVQQSRKEDAAVIRKDIDTDYDDDERDCSLELDPYDTHSSRFVNQNTWPQGGVLSLHSLVNLKRISLTGKVGIASTHRFYLEPPTLAFILTRVGMGLQHLELRDICFDNGEIYPRAQRTVLKIIAKHAPHLRRLDLAGDFDWDVEDIGSISKLGRLECLGLDKRTWSALRPLPAFLTNLSEGILQRSSALDLGRLWVEAFMDAPTLEALQDEENDLPIGNMHFTWKPPQPVEAKGGYHQPPPEDWASAPSYAVGNSLDGDPSQQSRAGSSLGPITGLNRRFFTERPLPAAPGTSPSQQHLSTSGTPPLLEGNQRSATDDDGLDQFDGPNPRETVVALGALFSQLTYLDLGHWFLHGPVLARMGKSMSCLQYLSVAGSPLTPSFFHSVTHLKALKGLDLRGCQAATEDEAGLHFFETLTKEMFYPEELSFKDQVEGDMLKLLLAQHLVHASNDMPSLFWIGIVGWRLNSKSMLRCFLRMKFVTAMDTSELLPPPSGTDDDEWVSLMQRFRRRLGDALDESGRTESMYGRAWSRCSLSSPF